MPRFTTLIALVLVLGLGHAVPIATTKNEYVKRFPEEDVIPNAMGYRPPPPSPLVRYCESNITYVVEDRRLLSHDDWISSEDCKSMVQGLTGSLRPYRWTWKGKHRFQTPGKNKSCAFRIRARTNETFLIGNADVAYIVDTAIKKFHFGQEWEVWAPPVSGVIHRCKSVAGEVHSSRPGDWVYDIEWFLLRPEGYGPLVDVRTG